MKFATDRGLGAGSARALNGAIVAYCVMVVVNYFVGRKQYMAINQAGEGFLRDLRVRVFDRLQAQSMAFFDRNKAGVLVSRMTADIESMGELIQWGLLQFVGAGLLLVITLVVLIVISWQLTLVVLLVLPDHRRRVGAVPAQVERGVPRGARERRAEPLRAAGGHRRRARHPGLRPRRRADAPVRAHEPPLFDSHMHAVRISVWYFGLVEFVGVFAIAVVVGVGGWLAHNGSITVGTVAAFVLLLANLFEPVQQLSQLYNTVQSAAASLHKLYG